MHFVYSGNFLAKAQRTQFGSLRMALGIHPDRFCWKLGAGETFQAPEAVLVYSDAGLGKMSRTLHDLYRNHLIRSSYPAMQKTAETILCCHRAKEADEAYCMPIKNIISLIPEE